MDEDQLEEAMMIIPVAAVTQMVIAAYNDGFKAGAKSVAAEAGGPDLNTPSPFLDRDQ